MSVVYDQHGHKTFLNDTFQGKPYVRQLIDTGHPVIKLYEIVQQIDHPNIVKIYRIHKLSIYEEGDTTAIDMEFFTPMLEERWYHIFTAPELRKIKDALKTLNAHRIIMVKLTRENICFVDHHKFKIFGFGLDQGIQSINNPYRWYFKPWNFDKNKERLRSCNFYSYLSGVYKLTELDDCAFELFKRANKKRKTLIHQQNVQMALDEEIPSAA
jgi:hypothetical protein